MMCGLHWIECEQQKLHMLVLLQKSPFSSWNFLDVTLQCTKHTQQHGPLFFEKQISIHMIPESQYNYARNRGRKNLGLSSLIGRVEGCLLKRDC